MSNYRHHNQDQADEFIEYLCCWRTSNPKIAILTRSEFDYRKALEKIIEVNANRNDSMGRCEIIAAQIVLDKLDSKK